MNQATENQRRRSDLDEAASIKVADATHLVADRH